MNKYEVISILRNLADTLETNAPTDPKVENRLVAACVALEMLNPTLTLFAAMLHPKDKAKVIEAIGMAYKREIEQI